MTSLLTGNMAPASAIALPPLAMPELTLGLR